MSLGVGEELAPCLIECFALADAVEEIEDRLVFGLREEHAIACAERDAVDASGIEGAGYADAVFSVFVEVDGNGKAQAEAAMQLSDGERRVGQGPQALGMRAYERERNARERVARQLVFVEVLRPPEGLRLRMALV